KPYNASMVYAALFVATSLLPLYTAYHLSTQTLWGIVQVNDDSMYPALESGDVLLVDRLAFWGREPGRGEMVVLRVDDEGAQANHVRLGRIIAQEGDEVLFEGTAVWVNGEPLQQWVYMNEADVEGTPVYIERNAERSYLIAGQATPPPDASVEPIQVSESQMLIIGDNRGHAMTRRLFWTAQRDQVLGKPIYLLYSSASESGSLSQMHLERSGLKIR
ncbi:MAG: signal peptidase I, partial [Myxococcota bacterium]